jgi:hypothetical protein
MTPNQFYFPYFFDLEKFNDLLTEFELSSFVTMDDKTKIPKELVVTKKSILNFLKPKSPLFTIPFGVTLMIQNDYLFYWSTEYNKIDIIRIDLKNLLDATIIESQNINLLRYSIGHNNFDNKLDLIDFITYVRKDDLKYDQAHYEKFMLVFINKDDINLIPFDWFNKSGGDYGYVWPAIAKFDKVNFKLYGQGMRMSDFVVDIEKACL